MKRLFFFYILLFPYIVSASSIKELKVLNGTLSREFEATNNIYSVNLNKGETTLKLDYKLENNDDKVFIEEENEKVTIKVTNQNQEEEIYVFFVNKEESKKVFKEQLTKEESKSREIPNIKYYVSAGVILINLILFKIIVIGKKK